jgi:hypothetical protein
MALLAVLLTFVARYPLELQEGSPRRDKRPSPSCW